MGWPWPTGFLRVRTKVCLSSRALTKMHRSHTGSSSGSGQRLRDRFRGWESVRSMGHAAGFSLRHSVELVVCKL